MPCPLCHANDSSPVGDKDGYRIVACGGCGLRHVGNMPTLDELGAYYAAYHGNVKNVRNAARKVNRWWRRLLPLKLMAHGGRFLDVGCNTGFAVEAARRLGFAASGYDLSSEAVAHARATYPQCRFDHGTAQTAAASGQTFDAVLCSEMIEHLTELDSFAQALATLVRPGGLLYLTTPNAGRYRRAQKLLAWKEVCPPHHLIYFDRAQIRRFLESAGFKIMLFMPVLHKPSIRVFARRV